MRLADLATPALILDRRRLLRNTTAMASRMTAMKVGLRPHMKTAKSAAVARLATTGHSGAITVSTLAEAEYFLGHGFRDMIYAVGIVPAKLDRVAAVQAKGAALTIVTDDVGVARAIVERASSLAAQFRVLIEIDTGGERAGVAPDRVGLLEIARALHHPPAVELAGVIAHAGHSYDCASLDEIRAVAEEERAGAVLAAERLRAAGFPCPIISAGSTPTALHGQRFDGLTEMRPGNYVFFDLFQAGIGSCTVDDLAVSVLASVIGHSPRYNHILIDAGGLALSKDFGANKRRPGIGFGLVADAELLAPLPGLAVIDVHQEHGVIGHAKGLDTIDPLPFDRLPVGSRVRILPNHVCMTAAMYDRYHVVDGHDQVIDQWDRVNGW